MKLHLTLAMIAALAACTPSAPPTSLDGKLTTQQAAKVERLLPSRLALFNRMERHGLQVGRPLTPAEQDLAGKLGVQDTARVRVVKVERIPMVNTANRLINSPVLPAKVAIREVGALTTGHAIYISKRFAGQEWVLAHELVHVAQLEAVGKVALLRRVLTEQITHAGRLPPIEAEAINRSAKVLGITPPPYAF